MSSEPALLVVQTAIPAYRQGFVDQVFAQYDGPVKFVTGAEQFQRGVVTELRPDARIVEVKNRYLLGRRLLWQGRVVSAALRSPACVIEINARIVSSWVILLLRKLRGRPTVMHGHAFSRQGAGSPSNRLRMLMCRLADAIVVYTVTERAEMVELLGQDKVWAAPNAMSSSAAMQPVEPVPDAASVVISGRSTAAKKPQLALAAFAIAADLLPPAARLVFVGVGPLLNELQADAERSAVAERVDFLGSVFDDQRLREIYSHAIATLSPGYVGLSMTQSHAFGLPMIYARDEPHAPEIEAADEGFNSICVPSDDAAALAEAIVMVWRSRPDWLARRAEISRRCRESYSVEAMAAGYLEAVRSTQ